ncbi:hypothetical protein [Actinoplanes auranticolor]|uniref:Uncharacterized protein n=1 Tax=Actinoplanes auranticolor TaxID=47988 RepID=A0A919SI32_9ACTN|nr:hypothetical protein [Actinoplanes auranticolor]GIM72019.1 hypothetical protein Aau02nite_48870 [Actinoplanes auranticolor]
MSERRLFVWLDDEDRCGDVLRAATAVLLPVPDDRWLGGEQTQPGAHVAADDIAAVNQPAPYHVWR